MTFVYLTTAPQEAVGRKTLAMWGSFAAVSASADVRRSLSSAFLCFREGRPPVLWMFALRFTVGGVLAVHVQSITARDVEAEVSWFLAVWFVYLLNGVTDIAGDRANGSTRPLASGVLTTRFALAWVWSMALGATVIALFVDTRFLLEVGAMLALGVFYSVGTRAAKKSAVGALTVAASGAFLTYLAGAEAWSGSGFPAVRTIVLAAFASAWIAVAGHTKDFGDVAGDRLMGRRTLPLLLGARRAAFVIVSGVIVLGTAAVTTAELVPGEHSLLALGPGALTVASILLFTHRRGARIQAKRPYRAFMAVQFSVNISALLAV